MHETTVQEWWSATPVDRAPAQPHRPLLAALGVSICLHLMLLAGLHWQPPVRPLARPAPLTAYLAPLPAAPARPAAARPAVPPRSAPAQAAHPRPATPRHHPQAVKPAHVAVSRSPVMPRRPPDEDMERPVPGTHVAPRRPVPHGSHHLPPMKPSKVVPHRSVMTGHRPTYPAEETAAPEATVRSQADHAAPPVYASALQQPRRHRPEVSKVPAGRDDQGLPTVQFPAPGRSPAAATPDAGRDVVVLGRGRAGNATPDGAAPAAAEGVDAPAGLPDRAPLPVHPVHPVYPLAARRDNIEGAVVVRIWVGADGTVTNAQVLHASPPGYFESAALDAVRQWHFAPAIRHGRPVAAVVASYTLRFSLLDAED